MSYLIIQKKECDSICMLQSGHILRKVAKL